MPHNRLEHLQGYLATPMPASTQWDVVSARVGAPTLVYRELLRLGAQGTVVHNDDTHMRILAFMGKRRIELLRRGALPDTERTGLFTTAVVSIVDARTLALFFTGRKHAGYPELGIACTMPSSVLCRVNQHKWPEPPKYSPFNEFMCDLTRHSPDAQLQGF
jgi:hypothetical protein